MPKYLALAEDVSPSMIGGGNMKLSSLIGQRHAKWFYRPLLQQEEFFSLLSNSFTEQQMIGGLHRTFYNASVQQTELTLFLMFDFYWNNCRIITILGGIIDAFSGIRE